MIFAGAVIEAATYLAAVVAANHILGQVECSLRSLSYTSPLISSRAVRSSSVQLTNKRDRKRGRERTIVVMRSQVCEGTIALHCIRLDLNLPIFLIRLNAAMQCNAAQCSAIMCVFLLKLCSITSTYLIVLLLPESWLNLLQLSLLLLLLLLLGLQLCLYI